MAPIYRPPSVSCKDVQRVHETNLGKRRVAMELLAGRSFLDAHFVRSLLPDPLDRALASKRQWETVAWGARAAIRWFEWFALRANMRRLSDPES